MPTLQHLESRKQKEKIHLMMAGQSIAQWAYQFVYYSNSGTPLTFNTSPESHQSHNPERTEPPSASICSQLIDCVAYIEKDNLKPDFLIQLSVNQY